MDFVNSQEGTLESSQERTRERTAEKTEKNTRENKRENKRENTERTLTEHIFIRGCNFLKISNPSKWKASRIREWEDGNAV